MLLRLEGAALFVLSLVAYGRIGSSWWLFAALFLLPDLSMLGYLANPKVGALSYNGAHTLAGPALLLGLALALGSASMMALSFIWLAHIGFDRMLGFGLKYATGFSDTHLGRLGRQRPA